jgi:FkbM family methyltransferase
VIAREARPRIGLGALKLLGGRSLGFAAREVVRPANWVALARMPRRYPRFIENSRRYFMGGGNYPYRCKVRTPQGIVAPTVFSYHDMLTVNEVFCREDYRVGSDLRVAVDIGSNIGISALYFLTRTPKARVWLYDPVPRNVERLRSNLAGFEGRWRIEDVAVADRDGEGRFAVGSSGRYGSLELESDSSIQVRVRHINSVLREVLDSEDQIDVLKLDIEGSEARTLQATSPELLAQVGVLYAEDTAGTLECPPGFEASRRATVLRLVNRRLSASG